MKTFAAVVPVHLAVLVAGLALVLLAPALATAQGADEASEGPAQERGKPAEAEKARAEEADPEKSADPETKGPAQSPPGQSEDDLRKEIRDEFAAEMKASLAKTREEMRAEIRAAVAASLAAEEWEPDEWEIDDEEKLEFFEMNGYFRFRADTFLNFDMNAGEDVNGAPLFARPGFRPDESDTLATANQRLRLQPILNVSEDIRVKATIDLLDNLVWGQTPDAFPVNIATLTTPMMAFTGTAVEPIAGRNASMNSISVKRVWAEIMTPVGQLRFGRLGSQWGLGLLANDGNCLDCDAGDTVDRMMFVTKIFDHYIVPAMDIPATGPISRKKDTYQGQPFDLEQRDDVQQYILAVARRDTPEDIKKMLLDGRVVFNYGMYNVLRVQNIDAVTQDTYVRAAGEARPSDFVTRGAKAYVPDIWLRLHWGKLRVELEAVGIFGHIDNGNLFSEPDPGQDAHLKIQQIGAVVQADYALLRDQLKLGFEAGFASGDSAPGMGIVATPGGRIQAATAGSIDGKQFNFDSNVGPLDNDIKNFKFDPNYHVDLILWREIFGQVTDAVYLKPSLKYQLTRSLGIDLAAIYSRAVFKASTPGGVHDLGLEFDGTLSYRSSDGFIARVQYGILIPMGGLALENKAQVAQTLQAGLAIEF